MLGLIKKIFSKKKKICYSEDIIPHFDKPLIIPEYGCCNKFSLGLRCKGDYTNTIDLNKYCFSCYNYDSSNSVIKKDN